MANAVEDVLRRIEALEAELHELRLGVLTAGIETSPTGSFSVLLTRVGTERTAVLRDTVSRVVRYAALVPLPDAPACVPGALDLHGELLPVIDVAARLGRRRGQPALSENIVIVGVGGKPFGVLVQETVGVYEVSREALILPPPEVAVAPWVLGTILLEETRIPLIGPGRLVVSTLGGEIIDNE